MAARCSRMIAMPRFEPSEPPRSSGSAQRRKPALSARRRISRSRSYHSSRGTPPFSKSVRAYSRRWSKKRMLSSCCSSGLISASMKSSMRRSRSVMSSGISKSMLPPSGPMAWRADLRSDRPRRRSRRGPLQPGRVPGSGAAVGLLLLGDLEVGPAVAAEAGQVAEVGGEVAQGEADAAEVPELADVDQLVGDQRARCRRWARRCAGTRSGPRSCRRRRGGRTGTRTSTARRAISGGTRS